MVFQKLRVRLFLEVQLARAGHWAATLAMTLVSLHTSAVG